MYKRHRFPPEIIQHVVWLYHRFNLSSRDIEDIMAGLRNYSLNTSSAIFDRACVFSQAITGRTAALSDAAGDRTIQ